MERSRGPNLTAEPRGFALGIIPSCPAMDGCVDPLSYGESEEILYVLDRGGRVPDGWMQGERARRGAILAFAPVGAAQRATGRNERERFRGIGYRGFPDRP